MVRSASFNYQGTMEDFNLFVQNLIDGISNFDKLIAMAKLYPKMNRDLRFAKDKSPYKTYLYAIINEGGRKSGKSGYFVVLNPGESYIGGGAFQPEPTQLKKIRQEIDYNFANWRKIAGDKKLLENFPDGITARESLQKVPKDFDKDSPAKEFLKMKGFFVRKYYPDTSFRAKDNFDTMVESFKACQQLNNFVNAI
jgi:uncharacterized protein (TIGR02453 family)